MSWILDNKCYDSCPVGYIANKTSLTCDKKCSSM